MIRINLLPIEYQAKSRRIPMPNKVSIIIYGAVIAMIAAGSVGYLRQSTALSELQLRRDIAAQEETRLAAQSRAIEKMEMRAAMLGDRIRLIENLQGQRFENVSWLNAVNRVLPTQLWMVQATRNMAGGHTTVEGVAEGYQPIAKLMEAMGATGRFSSVQLMQAQRQAGVKTAPIHFTVGAGWIDGQSGVGISPSPMANPAAAKQKNGKGASTAGKKEER